MDEVQQLNIQINPELYKEIKIAAIRSESSVKNWVSAALREALIASVCKTKGKEARNAGSIKTTKT